MIRGCGRRRVPTTPRRSGPVPSSRAPSPLPRHPTNAAADAVPVGIDATRSMHHRTGRVAARTCPVNRTRHICMLNVSSFQMPVRLAAPWKRSLHESMITSQRPGWASPLIRRRDFHLAEEESGDDRDHGQEDGDDERVGDEPPEPAADQQSKATDHGLQNSESTPGAQARGAARKAAPRCCRCSTPRRTAAGTSERIQRSSMYTTPEFRKQQGHVAPAGGSILSATPQQGAGSYLLRNLHARSSRSCRRSGSDQQALRTALGRWKNRYRSRSSRTPSRSA